MSVGFLLVVARVRGERLPAGRDGRLLGRLGLLNPGLAYALSLLGLAQITASLSVLLWALEPMLILALATIVLRERVGSVIVGLSAVAVAGLVVVVFDPLANGSALGIVLTVAGVGVCAVYAVAARRWLPGSSDSTVGVVLAQQAWALGLSVLVLAGLALSGTAIAPRPISPAALAAAALSGLLYYAFAYLFYLTALRAVRASVAAASFYLVPVFGVGFGWLIGERLEPQQWLGAAVVVLAVGAISIRGGNPIAQPSSASASTQIATTPSEASRS